MEYLLWVRPCVRKDLNDAIRQRTPCSVARRDIQINNPIKYCSSLNRCVTRGAMPGGGGVDSILLGNPKSVSKKMIAVVVGLKE